ncbi:MAG: hypothetical protein EP324_08135 [Gammaproteobacteria bacterium]|nr:MAG: hypothetical protein EP324_08135 [Gammaproteobacteria bacterium]
MSDEYPLYPELTEQGKEEAQRVMDSFKPKLRKLLDEVLGDLYTDVSYYVESDHWTNYRNALMDGFKDYGGGKPNHEHDYKELRRAIYQNHKDEILADLNQDLAEENERLKAQIEQLQQSLSEAQRNAVRVL